MPTDLDPTHDDMTPRHHPRRRWVPAVALILAGALVGAACGDDDDDGATSTGDDSEQAPDDAVADGASSDLDAYCQATLAMETAGEPDIDFETATPEEMAAAAMEFANETLQPLADDIVANVPDEISADIDVLAASLATIGETGDFSAFETPETTAASERAHDYDIANCAWTTVDVVATDYAFTGVPGELDAGVVSFELANDGAEVHEIVLLKKNEDVTESFDELLALPQEEAEQKVTFLGVGGPVPTGESTYAVADLEPGEYIAICFIPMGTTAMDGPPPEGPPHFMSGMTSEFTVA